MSSPVSTVEPVVVSPEMVSKNASVKLRPLMVIISGSVAVAAISTQDSDTSRKPSRGLMSRLAWRVRNHIALPTTRLTTIATTKSQCSPSRYSSEQHSGSRYVTLNSINNKPSTRATGRRPRTAALLLAGMPAV